MARRVAVIGAGWAGLAAAVRATEAGHAVTLYDTAARAGGRARTVDAGGERFDNGQHILIGAYVRTLDLMRTVGVDPDATLARLPLTLRYPDGRGLVSPKGAPIPAFVRAVAGCVGWTWADRLALLAAAGGWALRGFRCDPALTVDQLCRRLPPAVREILIDPLCVAALNTPARDASAAVLLRVLHDALFSGPGSADLLLPRQPLGDLLPEPAIAWLAAAGTTVRLGHRVQRVEADGAGWRVDGTAFDACIVACPAAEAARLVEAVDPDWSGIATAMGYEPIVTVSLDCPGGQLAAPMLALVESDTAPAQFAFDHGAFGGPAGRFSFVVSGARRWVDRGAEATAQAVLAQATPLLPGARVVRTMAEKRATFRCVPGLRRAPARIRPGLLAAGDHVAGPYPATLEGAVRSGEAAAAMLQ